MAGNGYSGVVSHSGLLAGRRWRHFRESLTAYVFLFPSFLIIGVFGLFPIAFALYVSLHQWRILRGPYLGIANYTKALGNLAYVVAFWLVVLFVFLAVRALAGLIRSARQRGERTWLLWLAPGFVIAGGVFQFVRFVFNFLPAVLDIGEQVRGLERTRELFVQLFGEAWRLPNVQGPFRSALLILVAGAVLAFLLHRFLTRRPHDLDHFVTFTYFSLLLIGAAVLGRFTWTEIHAAYAEALANGESLAIGSQVVTVSAGFVLLGLSWWLWSRASRDHAASTATLLLRLGAAILLLIGAWVLIGELPQMIAQGDQNWWKGLLVTVYYSAGTVPFQLGIALFVAVLLFQEIRGKSFFRMIYFIPWVTPPVAAAAVFRLIFSGRPTAPLNGLLGLLGMEPLLWLNEPKGIFQLLVGPHVTLPSWAAGPSLALVVIIIYNIWSYVGYDAVIFLAGLGSIHSEYYEAAAIDGAGRFAQFRHITLPLLSPTTYFLTLIAVIGTFKAFNHIWVLRNGAALGTTDTATIVIFQEFFRNTRYGYASALAIVLMGVVLVLTLINQRIGQKRVFYG